MKNLLLTLTLILLINSKLFSQTIQVQGFVTDYTVVTLNLVGSDGGSPARNIYEGTYYFGTSNARPLRISWQSVQWVFSVDWLNSGVFTESLVCGFSSAPNPPTTDLYNWIDVGGVGLHSIIGDGTYPSLLSVNEINFVNKDIKAFPNPTQNILNIKSQSIISSTEILDSNGRIINSSTQNNNEVKLDIENFQSGMYLLKVTTENGTSIQKIIKK